MATMAGATEETTIGALLPGAFSEHSMEKA